MLLKDRNSLTDAVAAMYLRLAPTRQAEDRKTGAQDSAVFNADFSGQRNGIANIILWHHFA